MSTDTDRFDERLTGVENTIEQMNERFADINSSIDRLDNRMENRFQTLGGRMDDLDRKIERTETRILQRMTLIVGVATVILAIVQIWIA